MVRIGGKIMNFINIEQPLVSIIMACYNSIKTIDESISSVINQDYKNFEFLLLLMIILQMGHMNL